MITQKAKLYFGIVTGGVMSLVSVVLAHAQSWTVASTSALVSGAETSTASSVYAALPIVIPITIGLAVFFFFFGWLLSKAHGGR